VIYRRVDSHLRGTAWVAVGAAVLGARGQCPDVQSVSVGDRCHWPLNPVRMRSLPSSVASRDVLILANTDLRLCSASVYVGVCIFLNSSAAACATSLDGRGCEKDLAVRRESAKNRG